MKVTSRIIQIFLVVSLIVTICACSGNTDRFKISGRFLNFNRGELFIYSPDNDFGQIDTIKVQDGRFLYEKIISEPTTFIIVFPNFTEVPVFGEPSRSAKITADASNLKEIEINGSKPNRMMNGFRKETESLNPIQQKEKIKDFVNENPESIVSSYLISRYLVRTKEPDYKTAKILLKKVITARPTDKYAKKLKNQIEILSKSIVGNKTPKFSIETTTGEKITNNFCTSKVGIISVWASWNYESLNIQRTLRDICNEYPDKIAHLSISLDMDKKNMESNYKANNFTSKLYWDGKVWDTPLLRQLGLGDVMDNIIIDRNGIIAFKEVENTHLKENIESLLKKNSK